MSNLLRAFIRQQLLEAGRNNRQFAEATGLAEHVLTTLEKALTDPELFSSEITGLRDAFTSDSLKTETYIVFEDNSEGGVAEYDYQELDGWGTITMFLPIEENDGDVRSAIAWVLSKRGPWKQVLTHEFVHALDYERWISDEDKLVAMMRRPKIRSRAYYNDPLEFNAHAHQARLSLQIALEKLSSDEQSQILRSVHTFVDWADTKLSSQVFWKSLQPRRRKQVLKSLAGWYPSFRT